jgi:tripartite-type tricarboxylate transporter receptor subunit TctC
MRKRDFLKAMALPFALPATRGFAQGGSGRTMRMIVPLPAGSGNDFVARVICPPASQLLGQTIVIENKPGASGVIGTMEVVRAAPDGLTLLCATNSHLATNVAFVKNLPYDPRKDVTPIAGATVANQVLVVSAGSPIKTFPEFVAYAKANPGKVSVGYSTSVVQLQFATLARMAGIELLMVPYKGAPQAITDVLGGTLVATFDNLLSAISQVKAGKLRALAGTVQKRNPMMPDVPAIADTVPGFDFPLWNAFVGPAGMSPELVKRLGTAFSNAQRQQEVSQQLSNAASPPLIIEPDALKALIEADVTRYLRLAKEAGIQPE